MALRRSETEFWSERRDSNLRPQFHRVVSHPRRNDASLEDQMLKSEFRQTLGAQPWKRLNARLNASSDSYPTRRAIAMIVVSVVASISRAMCIRQSVR